MFDVRTLNGGEGELESRQVSRTQIYFKRELKKYQFSSFSVWKEQNKQKTKTFDHSWPCEATTYMNWQKNDILGIKILFKPFDEIHKKNFAI